MPLIPFFLLLLLACNSAPKQEYATARVTVYGLNDCGICSDTRDLLEEEGIPYTFVSVDKGETDNRTAMQDLVRAAYPAGRIKMPVIVVNDSVLIQPGIEEVVEVLKK